jgi:hypothetical protein
VLGCPTRAAHQKFIKVPWLSRLQDGCSILPGGTHVEDGLQLSADAVHEPVQEPSTPDEPAAPILAAAAPNLQHAIIAPGPRRHGLSEQAMCVWGGVGWGLDSRIWKEKSFF